MARLAWCGLVVLALSGCKLAPDGELYVKYDSLVYTVYSLSDNNPSTPSTLEPNIYYLTEAGTYTVSFSIEDYPSTRTGTFTYVATTEDEDYVKSEGGIWTPGEDKYYDINLWEDPPDINVWDFPH